MFPNQQYEELDNFGFITQDLPTDPDQNLPTDPDQNLPMGSELVDQQFLDSASRTPQGDEACVTPSEPVVQKKCENNIPLEKIWKKINLALPIKTRMSQFFIVLFVIVLFVCFLCYLFNIRILYSLWNMLIFLARTIVFFVTCFIVLFVVGFIFLSIGFGPKVDNFKYAVYKILFSSEYANFRSEIMEVTFRCVSVIINKTLYHFDKIITDFNPSLSKKIKLANNCQEEKNIKNRICFFKTQLLHFTGPKVKKL